MSSVVSPHSPSSGAAVWRFLGMMMMMVDKQLQSSVSSVSSAVCTRNALQLATYPPTRWPVSLLPGSSPAANSGVDLLTQTQAHTHTLKKKHMHTHKQGATALSWWDVETSQVARAPTTVVTRFLPRVKDFILLYHHHHSVCRARRHSHSLLSVDTETQTPFKI